ncbi:uncharacterized protein LOC143876790 isoform X2 [Tasmannia lanceolata]|uniref:uncharacterized protein LOC143876790 isoform X2 n=1 Tax=Tasmannia lanceolata TaxID=3420 RepID=UPI00406384E3
MQMCLWATPFSSSDTSTGYLQDAIDEWTDRCKRRRMLLFPHDQTTKDPDSLVQTFWNSDFHGDPLENQWCLSHVNNIISDESLNYSINSISNEATQSTETKTQEKSIPEYENLSSSSSYIDTLTTFQHGKCTGALADPKSPESRCLGRKKVEMKVAYPFALVKPGGIEGDVTLDEINERILMRPTRPVRHPVGEFACLPCVSADGPGLSGKTVVGLTRIHTQGRGTVTIIRTRG